MPCDVDRCEEGIGHGTIPYSYSIGVHDIIDQGVSGLGVVCRVWCVALAVLSVAVVCASRT
jgi:hypothetical protein